MSRARLAVLVLVLGFTGAAAWYARRGSAPAPEGSEATGNSSVADRLATLERSLAAVEDGLRNAPRDRWDPGAVVRQVGQDPDSLREWVRDHTSWIPYRGLLRGPVGVLMDRQGNGLDRAALLAALLAEAGHTVRLARGTLPLDEARRRLPDLAARRPGPDESAEPADGASVADIAAGYQLDGPAIENVLAIQDSGTARLFTDLGRRVPAQTARLLEAAPGPDPDVEWRARYDSALAALQDHWWVQVEQSGTWRDLDPTLSASDPRPVPLDPIGTVVPSDLPDSLVHAVLVRVVEERLAGGALTEQRVLEHRLTPHELFGRPIVLQFWPAAWPNRAPVSDDMGRATRETALSQEAWSASLIVGRRVVATTELGATSAGAQRAEGFGGLGQAITSGLNRDTAPGRAGRDSLLTAVWIEYRIVVPGREAHLQRRRVFDLIGPAARADWAPGRTIVLSEAQRLTRALALMMRTEILALAAQPAPEFVLHQGGSSLLANAGLLRAVIDPGFGSDPVAADSLLRQAEAGMTPLYTLAILRHDALGDRAFIDRPTVLTRHQYPEARGDSLGLEDATDIVTNEVGVALGETDGYAARVAQGVWDTNLEALFGATSRAAANTALAYDASAEWQVLTEARDEPTGLPADPDALLRQELRAGYTIVAPTAAIPLSDGVFTGWWRIDPETGDALGMAGNGWGQGAPDYTLHLAAFVEMAKPFVFAYALCQFIPQAANSLNILGSEFWRRGWSPSWTTRPEEGRGVVEVAAGNHRRCFIDAILAGFVATAPLLLRTLAYRTEAEMAAQSRLARARTLPSGLAPPGTGPRPRGYPAPGAGSRPGTGPGGGTLPGGGRPGVDPLGKTQPGGTGPRGGAAPPGSPQQAALQGAKAAQSQTERAAFEATRDFTQYRARRPNPGRGYPGQPEEPWDPNYDAELQARMWEAQQANQAAIAELKSAQRAARDAAAAARRAQGKGGFQPAPSPPQAQSPKPGCPPNCGNQNPTVPQQSQGSAGALSVGSAGVAGAVAPPSSLP